jgi:hypothetical protein
VYSKSLGPRTQPSIDYFFTGHSPKEEREGNSFGEQDEEKEIIFSIQSIDHCIAHPKETNKKVY